MEGPQLLRRQDVVAEQSAQEAEPVGILGEGLATSMTMRASINIMKLYRASLLLVD